MHFAHDVFLKRDTEDAVRLMGGTIALEAHVNIFCSDFMFYYCTNNLRVAMERVADLKGDWEGEIDSMLELFKAEDQELLYIKRTESTIMILIEEISPTRWFWKRAFVFGRIW